MTDLYSRLRALSPCSGVEDNTGSLSARKVLGSNSTAGGTRGLASYWSSRAHPLLMPIVLRRVDRSEWAKGRCYLPNQGYMKRVLGDNDGCVLR